MNELKNLSLEFEKTKHKPQKGMFVSLHNIYPVENINELGIIVDIKKDPLGFNYGVFEFYDKKNILASYINNYTT